MRRSTARAWNQYERAKYATAKAGDPQKAADQQGKTGKAQPDRQVEDRVGRISRD